MVIAVLTELQTSDCNVKCYITFSGSFMYAGLNLDDGKPV